MGFDAVIVCGPLRKMGKKLAFTSGVVRHAESVSTEPEGRHDVILEVGSKVDVAFSVKSDGITAEVMASVVDVFTRQRNHFHAEFDHTQLPRSLVSDIPLCDKDPAEVVLHMIGCVEPRPTKDGMPILFMLQLHSMSTTPLPQFQAALKIERHDVFAQWILSTFGGAAALATGVLDVAGGKGRLSHALAERDVPCKLVDPWAGLGRDPGKTFSEAHPDPDDSVLKLLHGNVSCIRDTLEGALATEPDLVTSSALLVAMHPDEATEGVVDAALASERPFAVVPCCVMPQLFPNRKLQSGVSVVKFGGFLRYLQQKDSRMRLTRLGFVGCDTVVFMTASDYERPAALDVPRRAVLPIGAASA